LASDVPRPEHPRPDFERKAWLNLNGEWQFAIDTQKSGLEKGWHTGVDFPLRIVVPFCPQSRLSGIGNADFMGAVWYRRNFDVDSRFATHRVVLHFGAVDYEAHVWVNGKEVAHHLGGYTPFSADITEVVDWQGENELVVYVVDEERSSTQPSGKQSHMLMPTGCMYSRTIGIWQTVWIEYVPDKHVSSINLIPSAANGLVGIEVAVNKPDSRLSLEASVLRNGEAIASRVWGHVSGLNIMTLEIPNPILWYPGKPFIYDLRVRLLEGDKIIDEVFSYFGLRDIEIDGMKIFVNGKPIFQRLVLDQGFWPEGIYTAPSDAELRADIERSMAMGFNGARLHQKIFEPRTLYWADKLGYIVWSEFPDWGCSVKHFAQARENFLREWVEVVLRDRNHPCIVAWVPLNEARFDTDRYHPTFIRMLYDLTKQLDPSRPVVDTSGYTHVVTDIWDLHDYDQDVESFAERYSRFGDSGKPGDLPRNDPAHEPPYGGQPVVVSEYGGIWWNPGQEDERSWGYGKRPASEQEFLDRFAKLTNTLLDNPRMAGFCYTQLADVEQEVNGLYTSDRKPKFPPAVIRSIVSRKAAIEAE
jgi:beta-galactosidase/beta-glucuronidase